MFLAHDLRLLHANLLKVPQRSSGARMQNSGEEAKAGRGEEQEMKILSHIHTFCQQGAAG